MHMNRPIICKKLLLTLYMVFKDRQREVTKPSPTSENGHLKFDLEERTVALGSVVDWNILLIAQYTDTYQWKWTPEIRSGGKNRRSKKYSINSSQNGHLPVKMDA